MKISSCYPQYIANDFDMVVDYLVNRQGFKIIHNNSAGINKFSTLENEKGYRIDVASYPGTLDGFYSTRINVDDIDDAISFFNMQSYETEGDMIINPELKMIFMSKEGSGRICLMQHIKG